MQGATAFVRPAVSLSDGNVLAFRPGTAEQQNLAWYDRKGQRLESVTTGSHRNFDLAPDGLRILTAGTDNAANVVLQIVDTARGVVSRVPAGAGEWANDPVWSPDGREVAYSQRTNRSRIVVRPVTGGEARTVFEPPGGDVWVEDWSRDGRFLAVGMGEDWMRPRIVLVPLDGGAPTSVPAQGGVLDEYHFSPDGRWLAYNSDGSGRHEVYVTSLPPKGEQWQVSSAGGVQARWRGDGREIYYIGLDGGLMAVAIGDGPTFSPSAPRRLFTLPDGLGSPILDEYAVSRDGQRFLILEPGGSGTPSPIDILVNWQTLLKTQ